MKPPKLEASLPDCKDNITMTRQETYYHLCDAVWEMGLAESRDEAKRMCIEGEISVNGTQERDPWLGVCRFDEITKGG